jgi:hypothetical protein
LYVDFEADAADVVERLKLLGASVAELNTYFTYVRPEAAPSESDPAWQELLDTPRSLATARNLSLMPPPGRLTHNQVATAKETATNKTKAQIASCLRFGSADTEATSSFVVSRFSRFGSRPLHG